MGTDEHLDLFRMIDAIFGILTSDEEDDEEEENEKGEG